MSTTRETTEAAGVSPWHSLGLGVDLAALAAHVLELTPGAGLAVYDRDLRYVLAAGPLVAGHISETVPAIGKTIVEIFPGVAALLLPHYRRALAGEPCGLEYVSPVTGRAYAQRFTPLRDGSGEVVAAMTVWQDVSERKRVERDLVESEARYRLLAERSEDAIVVFDRNSRYEYVSPAMERITGWTVEELLGCASDEFIHPDDLAAVIDRREQLGAGARDATGEVRFRHRDGGYVWIETRSTPVIDEATGAVVGVQASGRDVSERRRAQELFRALTELAPVGIFLTDESGGCAYVNPRWEEIAGRTAAETAGGRWSEAVHPDDRAAVLADFGAAQRVDSDAAGEFRFQRPDGTVSHVVMAATPLHDPEGKTTGYIGSITDVTELKEAEAEHLRLEARLQQARRLESLGVLAGGVAHDFNNLLVGILGNAALALGELSPDSAARRSIEQVELAARRAAELTRQMLAYSGKDRPVAGPVDLAELVRELAGLYDAVIGAGIQLRLDLPQGLPSVEGDATQLRQVVMNLIVNAGEAMAGGSGVVTVELALVDVDAAALVRLDAGTEIAAGCYLALRVTDTGSGMSEATRARIFEPFFTTKFTGRGLGLAATIGIVRGHGGGLEVASREGSGTTFTVYLPPVARGSSAVGRAPVTSPEPVAGPLSGTVLLIEDDDGVRSVAQRILESAGLEVVAVVDGAAAIEAVQADPARFVAVVLHYAAPVIAGAELVTALRERGVAAPLIVTSGRPLEVDALLSAEHGVVEFLQKPFGKTELVAVVRDVLERSASGQGSGQAQGEAPA